MDFDNTIASRKQGEEIFNPDLTMPGRRSSPPDAASSGRGGGDGGDEAQFDPDMTMDNRHGRREHGVLNVGDVVLNRYELLEKLGSGAMGVVFKCRDQVSLVEYALKMVPPELARDADAMDDVRRNFRLVHGLKHPNIAGVDFLDRDRYGAYFLVMEYAEGESLSQWIRRKWGAGRPEPDEVAGIVKQIAAALDFAHSQGVLHRDVKPANVMVSGTGQVKVLDFGLASKVRSSMSMLSVDEDTASGTPNYLSPEQFKGRRPRPASDQYALGVLTYQMLSGELPFDAESLDVLRSAVLNEDPEPVEGVSRAVNQCLLKVLNKDPKLRFASCAEFANELEGAFGKTGGEKLSVRGADVRDFSAYTLVSKAAQEEPSGKTVKVSAPEKPLTVAEQHRKAAEQGDANAQYDLAECYYYGNNGVRKIVSEAVKWYRKAAEQGHLDAAYSLGYCYYDGQGVAKDYAQAVKWFRKAADQGHAKAQYFLGHCRFYGWGIDEDLAEAVKWYRKAADQGHADAQSKLKTKIVELFLNAQKGDPDVQYRLGLARENGDGIAKNMSEAVKWYRKAAEQGHAVGQRCLGICCEYGKGVQKDMAEALKWYRKAADQGDADALNGLGICYEYGKGVGKDMAEAAKWYRKSAELGYAPAQSNLGRCCYNGWGVEKDFAEAVKWYRKAAEQGIANARYGLGLCYESGNGVEKNIAEAVKWYSLAAEQRIAEAQRRLGDCYYYGGEVGIVKNYSAAAKWYRKAADQGVADAAMHNNLGDCYYYAGNGLEKDYAEAVKWYRLAANQGVSEAQCKLGDCYGLGKGVPENKVESAKWYLKAAEQGIAEAQNALGSYYFYGDGVEKSFTEAVKWYRLAANQGNVHAQFGLGYCYEMGTGVVKNRKEALKWYRLAADQGNPNAAKQFRKLKSNRVWRVAKWVLLFLLILFVVRRCGGS